MTDKATSSLDQMTPEERAKSTVALLNHHLGGELRRLLLDDEFLLEFGPKLRRAMEGRPLVEAQDLDVEITEEPLSEMSFRVFVEREDHPTNPLAIYAFAQGSDEPADLSEGHAALIVEAITAQGYDLGRYHWVTLSMKGAKDESDSTDTSEASDVEGSPENDQ